MYGLLSLFIELSTISSFTTEIQLSGQHLMVWFKHQLLSFTPFK